MLTIGLFAACGGSGEGSNNAPVFSGTPTDTATEDSPYTNSGIGATDAEGDTLAFSLAGPSWLTVDPDSGALSGTPLNDHVGGNEFTVSVNDGNGGTASLPFTITVINSPDVEGSLAAPVTIPVGTYIGEVDATQSYYVLQSGGDLDFRLSGMSDDLDLYVFDDDGTYTTYTQRPFFGRTEPETSICPKSPYKGPVYLIVDGSYSAAGSAFTLEAFASRSCPSFSFPPTGFDEGSAAGPVPLQSGQPQTAQVADGTSYYQVAVTPGVRYTVALGDALGGSGADVSLFVYGTDDTFTSVVCSSETDASREEQCTLTTGGGSIYLTVVNFDNAGDEVLTLTVLSSEGTIAAPIPLFLDKQNFGQVNDLTSYYTIGVTPGLTYRTTVSFRSTNGLLVNFNGDSSFTTAADDCFLTGGSLSCEVTAAGDTMHLSVTDDSSSRGSYYRFRMTLVPVSVNSATATSATTVDVTFSAVLDPASVEADGSQFIIPGLPVSGASVTANTVTLNTSTQAADTDYTVTAGGTIQTVEGGALDPSKNSAPFASFVVIPQ